MMRFMASMTALLSNPSARLVGIFSAVAAILLAAGALGVGGASRELSARS